MGFYALSAPTLHRYSRMDESATRRLVLVPAIDLRQGRCVRLAQGDPTRETSYDADPVARAKSFAQAGAQRLHVVDLDGAFGSGENLLALRAICNAVNIPVQTGGGVRTRADVQARLDCSASYVILGTLLIENPELAQALAHEYRSRLIAGVDARDGHVATRGWLAEGGRKRDELFHDIRNWGIERVVYTEIARDGMGSGYDLTALADAAHQSPLRITASGGAHSLASLQALATQTPANVDHAIIGRALYEGTLDLAEAIAAFS